MGLKINGFGLVYNDAHTSSFGEAFEKGINISTSNKDGKYHTMKCTYCGRTNRIPISAIKQRLEIDSKSAEARAKDKKTDMDTIAYDRAKGSMLSWYCGNCKMLVSTSISHKDIEIYDVKEYGEEVASKTDSLIRIANRNGIATPLASQLLQRSRK